jgi:PAS domain S-box-containing protein
MNTVAFSPEIPVFLNGDGEMSQLTRSYDWSGTPVGPISEWPQSLRTTVGILLHSDFPMFLWWGEPMTQFYNDAYRPSLGNEGKHPGALGQDGKTCWPEIWDIIYPLIEQVRTTKKSFFSEDQLIPIYRNGQIENVYWTFSYSAVIGESGNVDGVLVVCNETTKKVNTLNEIKTAQRLLKESENNLRNIILQAPVAMCIFRGPDHVVEIANQRMFEFWGKPAEELLNKPIFEGLPEARYQGFEDLINGVFSTGETFSAVGLPISLPRKGHMETIYVNFVYEPLFQEDGKISGIMAVVSDVTQQVLAAKRVEESEQRYKTLITESTVAIALYIGRELRIQYANDIMISYWGKDSSVQGKTMREAIPELEGQSFFQTLDNVYTTGQTYIGTEEKALLVVDGELKTFYFNFIYKALRNSEGQVYAIHHMAMDVTEQVIARKQVEQSEANLRNIILQAPVAMCIYKGDEFVIEIANSRMFEFWGRRAEEVMDKPLFEALPEAKGQGFEELMERTYRTGQSFSAYGLPATLLRNGRIETVFINFAYEALREGDGSISGIMAVASEVTEQIMAAKKIEEVVKERTLELAVANERLKKSNAELSQFAYIASHDLQEPARKIRTFTELLEKNLQQTDQRSKTYLEKIDNSAERMLTLIRDVLTFSQLSGARDERSTIDMNLILKNVLDDFELLIEEKRAMIVSDVLPVIHGIPIQISQLFGNLISNGLKFISKDRPPVISIKVSYPSAEEIKSNNALNPELNYCRISFADNGIGFNQVNARQIFDIFQRLHGKAEYLGTGIGLAICKKIAQNHKGDIYAESSMGKGATFHVTLPINLKS